MNYMTAREAADKWGISQRRVAVLCSENRIENAARLGNMWVIPNNAEKPIDARSTRYNMNADKCVKPFLKWAGGKRQIIDKLKQYAPDEFDTYYEPFIGGGALLFELSPKKAVINDYNEELMNVFRCIKEEKDYIKMCNELNRYEVNHSEEFYYEIRCKDKDKAKYNKMPTYKKAARTDSGA